MDKLIPLFELSVFDSNLSDTVTDITELGIDTVLDDGLLKDIPIVRTVIGAAKTAQNIYDRNLLRQTAVFILEFNSGGLNPEKLLKYRQRINSNPNLLEKELGRVMILLNDNIDLKKSKILANFYKSYVLEEISWDKFCELTDVLNRSLLVDITLLLNIYNDEDYAIPLEENYRIDRLVSQGLIQYKSPTLTYNTLNLTPSPIITPLGRLFASLINS